MYYFICVIEQYYGNTPAVNDGDDKSENICMWQTGGKLWLAQVSVRVCRLVALNFKQQR